MIKVSFDKSAIEFMLKAFGYTVVQGQIMKLVEDGSVRVKCCYCGITIDTDNFAGFVKYKNKTRLICKALPCLMEHMDASGRDSLGE
jgi:hypothetical protein